ncbi:MAG: NAD-dependent epimerase/dehydratase family protein [Gemmataceae bacterium]|nr:NAD-dependent epimerase/dehydratase family protein [Gemmataceae bacterium]
MAVLSLVTGGAGFIGSHLVDALAGRGPVRVLDDLSTGVPANVPPGVELRHGDVGDPAAVDAAMKGVGQVFHLAALASVQRSVEAPADSHRVCATGTLHVLDAARREGVRRVVYAASASAYGIPAAEVQKESDPVMPLSPYAAAKLAGEVYCQAFASTYGLETVRLRFFNIFGPRQRADSPYSGVIAIFADMLAKGKVPTIFGDGQQTRDFTYVSDVVDCLLLASEKPGVSGEVYNVGTGQPTSLLDLVAALNAALGTSIAPRHAEARAGDIRHSRADISRTRAALGYAPKVAFAEGLRRTLGR